MNAVSRAEGDVRSRMQHGRVDYFVRAANYGFIQADSGERVWFHARRCMNNAAPPPEKNNRVVFDKERGERGWKAIRWDYELT